MQRGTFKLMKSVNKSLVLNKIRKDGPISRAQIAKDSKLTPPTVSSFVKELLEEGLVKEKDLGKSNGGRKPTMLEINYHHFYIIGVDSGSSRVDVILSDLSGKIYERISADFPNNMSKEQFLIILSSAVRDILSKVTRPDKVLGIGVAMHGVVQVETGTSLIAPSLGLENIPIKETLENEFNLEVYVENDARAMALGESWFGEYGDQDSMMTINIGNGVGSGLVVDGNLYHGAQDIAGEIGHMMIDIHGEVCECGNKGCLQTFISGSSIARRANKLREEHFASGKDVYEAMQNGNTSLKEVFEETGMLIGIGITNLIHVVNPKLIVLGGGVMNAEEMLLPAIHKTIAQHALTPEAKETKVVVSKLGKDAALLGATALVLVEIFN
ncbi:ROK family transcriptional regulator [Oceanobacillus sojae]|uniref:ROK family transcriptional regulator n=1 Tax=Oceanobacillus sojae TaxID=582851 RepID=UPI0009884E68|nr:ROK family transcriptional regulator [Oceanobacillus sojae]